MASPGTPESRIRGGAARGRWVPLLGVLGVAGCALAAALARPRERQATGPTAPALRAVLVDVSASVTRTRSGFPLAVHRLLREEARAAQAAGEELVVVEFAAEVRVVFGPGDPARFSARLEGLAGVPYLPGPRSGRDWRTDLAGALTLVGPLLGAAGRAPGQVVIAGDGWATGDDPAARLAALARDGAHIEWRFSPPPDLDDLALEDLILPRQVEAGAPVAVGVDLAWLRPDSSRLAPLLVVHARGAGAPDFVRELALDVPRGTVPDEDGKLRWRARVELPPWPAGRLEVTLRARLRGADGKPWDDPIPENDRARGGLRVGHTLVGAALASPALRGSLESLYGRAPFPGVELIWCSPAELAPLLAQVDFLLTFDVGPGELPAASVTEFVRAGGGWLACVGWSFLASWTRPTDAGRRSLSALLPLFPARELGEERDVILMVDGSGSMEGEPFERVRSALFELVPAALPNDHVQLRFFTQALGPVEFSSSGRTPAERRRELAPLLEARVPRGGTDILYSLRQLAELRAKSPLPGLVLLLTDGRSTVGGAHEVDAVRRALVEKRLELRVLAVGPSADLSFLQGLLPAGEAVIDAGDLSDLARLLALEVNRRRVRRQPGLVPQIGQVRDPLAREILAAWESADDPAADPADWGDLDGYARAESAPGSEVLLRSNVEGDPLLALARVGQGLVACSAAHPGPGWAPFLGQSAGLLDPLLRALGRFGPAPDAERPRLVVRGRELVLQGADRAWPPRLWARFQRAVGAGDLDPFPGDLAPHGSGLGCVPLDLWTGGTALDPRRRRSGPLPGFLDELPAGEALEVRIEGPGRRDEILATLVFEHRGPAEWTA
ncbi:MAG: VWA domain-containing protein, partial [Planctomycetota bacterium]